MFTGIVQTVGRVKNRKGGLIVIKTNSKIVRAIPKGGSVSIDGVCLTALKRDKDSLTFELIDSTLRRTTLGHLKKGDAVNVEPAMLAGQPIGGHFISGHVDGLGVIQSVSTKWHTRYLIISVPKKILKYFISQGSVVVNGVSLTIVSVTKTSFSVALTDYTLKHTNLKDLKKSDKVNIEVDLLAKYLEKYVRNCHRKV